MANKQIWLGMLALALVFGMAVVGCDNFKEDDPGPTGVFPPGTVTIIGTTYVSQVLTANTDNLGGSGNISYKWYRGNTADTVLTTIDNATGKNYFLTDADLYKYISVYVTRSNYLNGIVSNVVGPITEGPPLTGTVSITGTAKVGQTLTANTSSLGGSGSISYQWKRGDSSDAINININNATESNYTLSSADFGKYVIVSVTRSGHGGNVSSTATGPIADAIIWTQVSNSIFGTGKVNAVAYNNNQWIAVGDGGILAYSTNGEAWTKIDLSTIFTDGYFIQDITGIAYGNGKWIAVGGNGSNNAAFSTDGTTWTAIDRLMGRADCVAYGNNKWIIGNRSGGMVTSSDNGTTWISVTNPLSRIYSIAYGNNRWVAVGNNASMATSTNGTTWTTVDVTSIFTSMIVQSIYTVAYGNNQWIAAGSAGIIATSTNGQNWTASTGNPLTSIVQTVAYGNNKWFAAGGSLGIFPTEIAVSTNGNNWVSIGNTTFDDTPINCIAFGNNKWVAVGDDGKIAYANDN